MWKKMKNAPREIPISHFDNMENFEIQENEIQPNNDQLENQTINSATVSTFVDLEEEEKTNIEKKQILEKESVV